MTTGLVLSMWQALHRELHLVLLEVTQYLVNVKTEVQEQYASYLMLHTNQ